MYNRLYAFAHTYPNLAFKFISKLHKITGSQYKLHHLPMTVEASFDLPLIEGLVQVLKDSQHFSIFEEENSKEYHYTSYYQTLDKSRKFRLHAFYNKKDQLVKLELAEEKSPDNFVDLVMDQDVLEQIFGASANKNTRSFMQVFRNAHNEYLKRDALEFTELDQKLSELSKSLPHNRGEYLACLKENIVLLKKIIPYHYDSAYYQGILFLFQKIEKNLEIAAKELKEVPEPEIDALSVDNFFELSDEPKPFKPKPVVKKSLKNHRFELEQAFKTFSTQFTDGSSIEDLVKYYTNFNELVQNFNLFSTEIDYSVDSSDLEALRKNLIKNAEAKQKLLNKLFETQQFALAEKVIGNNKDYVFDIPHLFKMEVLVSAIENDNAELLDFLLSHFVYSINTDTFPNGESLVRRCFRESKLSGLSVLVKHGASLMESCPSSNLPIAFFLLTDITHPLRKVLIDNQDKTLQNRKFYRELLESLKSFNTSKENSLVKDIGECRQICLEAISSLEISATPVVFYTDMKITETAHSIIVTNATDIKELLASDAKFQKTCTVLSKLLTSLQNDYAKLLSPIDRRAYKRCQLDELKAIRKYQEDFPLFDLPELKDEIIKKIKLYISLYQNLINYQKDSKAIKNKALSKNDKKKLNTSMLKIQIEVNKISAKLEADNWEDEHLKNATAAEMYLNLINELRQEQTRIAKLFQAGIDNDLLRVRVTFWKMGMKETMAIMQKFVLRDGSQSFAESSYIALQITSTISNIMFSCAEKIGKKEEVASVSQFLSPEVSELKALLSNFITTVQGIQPEETENKGFDPKFFSIPASKPKPQPTQKEQQQSNQNGLG